MEDSVFLEVAVADLMKKELVECRLHTDTQNTLTAEQFAKNREVQASIAGTKANPYFVMVDPNTGAKVSEFALSGDWSTWPSKWIDFVNEAVQTAGKTRK
jgi:hypothetical protein